MPAAAPAPGPTGAPGGLDLLQRSLDYTRGALGTVRPDDLCLPTPCELWRLGDLLGHMEDALDAFAEAARGTVALRSEAPAPLTERVRSLQDKACGLLGAWVRADAPLVSVGGRPVPVDAIARLAALEILVHGWDVGRTTGRGRPLPDALAQDLLPAALGAATAGDGRFAPPLPLAASAPPGVRLLAALGRSPA